MTKNRDIYDFIEIVNEALSKGEVKSILKKATTHRDGLVGRMLGRTNIDYATLENLWAEAGYPNEVSELKKLLRGAGFGRLEASNIFRSGKIGSKHAANLNIERLADAIKKAGLAKYVIKHIESNYKIKESVSLNEQVLTDRDIKKLFMDIVKSDSSPSDGTDYLRRVHSELPSMAGDDKVASLGELVNYAIDRSGQDNAEVITKSVSKIIKSSGLPANIVNELNEHLASGTIVTDVDHEAWVSELGLDDEPAVEEPGEEEAPREIRQPRDMSHNRLPASTKDYVRHMNNSLQSVQSTIPVGTVVNLGDKGNYVWKGAQWVGQSNKRIIPKDLKGKANELGEKKATLQKNIPLIQELVNYVADRSSDKGWDQLASLAIAAIRRVELPNNVKMGAISNLKNKQPYVEVTTESRFVQGDLINESFFSTLSELISLGRIKKNGNT